MPTVVGILTFISMINTTSERLKAKNFFNFRYFRFYEQLKFLCSVELSMKIVLLPWGPGLPIRVYNYFKLFFLFLNRKINYVVDA